MAIELDHADTGVDDVRGNVGRDPAAVRSRLEVNSYLAWWADVGGRDASATHKERVIAHNQPL